MKNLITKTSFAFGATLLVLLPKVTMAADCNTDGSLSWLPCLTVKDPVDSTSPGTAVADYIKELQNYFLGFAGTLCILAIIWGGFLMVTSSGNPDRLKQAKTTLTYAIMGIIIVLMTSVVYGVITGDLLGAFFKGSDPFTGHQ